MLQKDNMLRLDQIRKVHFRVKISPNLNIDDCSYPIFNPLLVIPSSEANKI